MTKIKFDSPCTIEELVGNLKESDNTTKLLAGGTDLIIALNENRLNTNHLINLSGIEQIKTIEERDGALWIGACAIFTEIAKNALVQKHFTSLVQAAEGIGSKQIRNKGTIGGNLANSSPAGDMIPPLISLDASVITIDSHNTTKEIPVSELIIGVGENILAFDQAIIYIKVPLPQKERVTRFVKLGNRSMVTIARLSIAINFAFDDQKKIIDAVVALGAVGKNVFRAKTTENLLLGQIISEETKKLFAEALEKEVEKSIPGRYSLAYKKEAVKGKAYDIFDMI